MRIITLTEKESRAIDLRDLLDEDGSIVFEERAKRYFDFDFRGKVVTIVAGNHIGSIPITRGLVLDVRPKFKIDNLARILAVAQKRIGYLDFFKKHYQTTDDRSDIAYYFLVDCLLLELRALETHGEERQYSRRIAETSYPKGRIDIGRTVRASFSSGHQQRLVESRFDFTKDTPANRCIKYAIWYCLEYGSTKVSRDALEILVEHYERFRYIPLDFSLSFMSYLERHLNSYRFDPLRSHYYSIISICFVIINSQGLRLNEREGEVEASSFVIDLSDVFERYLRQALRNSVAARQKGLQILDGNEEGLRSLYCDKRKPAAKPDMVVIAEDGAKLIVEAKYKAAIKEVDRYQVIAHGVAFGAKACVLCIPGSDGNRVGLELEGHVGHNSPLPIYVYRFPLFSGDLAEDERRFAEAVTQLLDSTAQTS